MTPEALLTLTGDVLVCVRAADEWNILNLVRMKKMVAGIIPPEDDYDLNKDGVVDDADVLALRKILLGVN